MEHPRGHLYGGTCTRLVHDEHQGSESLCDFCQRRASSVSTVPPKPLPLWPNRKTIPVTFKSSWSQMSTRIIVSGPKVAVDWQAQGLLSHYSWSALSAKESIVNSQYPKSSNPNVSLLLCSVAQTSLPISVPTKCLAGFGSSDI